METYHFAGIALIIGFTFLCIWQNLMSAESPSKVWRNFCEDFKDLLSFFLVATIYILVCGGVVLLGIYACYKDPIGLYEENGFIAFYWYLGIGGLPIYLLGSSLRPLFESVKVTRQYKKKKELAFEQYKNYAHVINLLSYLRLVRRERYEAMNAFRLKKQNYLPYKQNNK